MTAPAHPPATVRLAALVIATADPSELARFWARALGWDVRDAADGGVELVPTDATSFGLSFRPVEVEKLAQNRIHVDLTTTSIQDQDGTVAALTAIGGRPVDIGQTGEEDHVVLADPDGNEFCVIGPENRFLASCPRLGAVNCDGTRALGQFYSRALGWPLVWDQDEETAIQAPDGTGPKVTWSGPPLLPKPAAERFHIHLAPTPGVTREAALDGLVASGATPAATIGHACPGATPLLDVDGNDVCLVDPD